MATTNNPPLVGPGMAWSVLCDFDGTISPRDTADCLIDAFGNARCQQLEQAWLAGEIGSRTCMGEQIAELRASRAELDRLIDAIHIDPGFPDFVRTAEALGVEVIVVSDGLDYVIARILARYGLTRLPIRANRLTATAPCRWRLSFPFARSGCTSGHCKCAQVRTAHGHSRRTLLIGDGTSDFCAAARADRVWAKGRLAEYCQQQRIAYQPLRDFTEARSMLSGLRAGFNREDNHPDDRGNRVFV